LVVHGSREQLYAGTVEFGGERSGNAGGTLDVVDGQGRRLVVDKTGRLQRAFDEFGQDERRAVVEAAAEVADTITERCGLAAHVTYGSLLGAVRSGHMIGHDSDVDLAYYSHCEHPYDVIREHRMVHRVLTGTGWQMVRMSAANLKVWLPAADGTRCGIDVFASFHIGPLFHLLATVRGPLPRSAVVPLGTVSLEGVSLPAPADPAAYLARLYGPGWQVPDPSFRFYHPVENRDRMGAWFRPMRRGLRYWEGFYESAQASRARAEPSPFASWAAGRMRPGARVLDFGCGNGRDAVWLARQGHRVQAVDFAPAALKATRRLAQSAEVELVTRRLNAEDLRMMLVSAADLSRRRRVPDIYARGLLDALSAAGRSNFWRFASMVQRRTGTTLVEFRTAPGSREPTCSRRHERTYLEPARVVDEVRRFGGAVVDQVIGPGLAPPESEDPHVCRLAVTWRAV
jgi:SAM-dependent methyltransferase